MKLLGIYSPPKVDRIWGRRGSYLNIPKAIFYLLKGDYKSKSIGFRRCGEAVDKKSGLTNEGRGVKD